MNARSGEDLAGCQPDETAGLWSVAGESIFYVVSKPAAPARAGVLLLQGVGRVPASNSHSLWVRLARALARVGVASVRLDYRGVGESSGILRAPDMDPDAPVTDEAAFGFQLLSDLGCVRLSAVGVCVGARVAAATALARDAPLARVLLLAPPVGSAFTLFKEAASLERAGTDVVVAYGDSELYAQEFKEANARLTADPVLGALPLDPVWLPGRIRGLTTLPTQAAVTELVMASCGSSE